MRFVEIEGNVINIDKIKYFCKVIVHHDMMCRIVLDEDNVARYVDESYYEKLKEIVRPIYLTKNNNHTEDYINVNDFPGDNMIEE